MILLEVAPWVCWLKCGNDKWYFDSFGLHPLSELDSYLGTEVVYPTEQIQPGQEIARGHLCLHV